VVRPDPMRERLRRASEYPYAIPDRSFIQLGERTTELADLPDLPDLAGRRPLLAYGSNASPEALVRKLAAEPEVPLPLIRAELDDFDVVYSDHVSPYGAVPATLHLSPGTVVTTFVAYPTDRQRRRLARTEPNYEEHRLAPVVLRLELGEPLTQVDAFLSRHGFLPLDGCPVALTAIVARNRAFPTLDQTAAKRLRASRAAAP
jgi:hypothetical protein